MNGFNLAHAVETVIHNHTLTEWVFIIISLIVAGIGIGLGVLFYLKKPRLPDIWAQRLRPLYDASYNKYWVDEFYGLAVTRRTMDLARAVYAFDSKVVDGVVNGSAGLTRLTSRITGGTDQYFVDGLVNAIAAFIMRLMSPIVPRRADRIHPELCSGDGDRIAGGGGIVFWRRHFELFSAIFCDS